MSDPRLPIAIAGGGIAGLALALNLHARGIPVRVFEAAGELRELGVGITLLPHAVRELTALGLADQAAALGVENTTSAFYNRFGQRVFAEPRGREAGYPFPEYGVHRGRLHMMLYRAVLDRLGPEAVAVGHRCIGFTQEEDSVTIAFADPTGAAQPLVTAAALIACDGVNSAIRAQFYPGETVRYTGINTWRGTTRMTPILDGRTYMRVGSIRTGKLVIYPIVDEGDGTQLVNWVAEIESATSVANDWNRTTDARDVLPLFADWTFDWLDVPAMIRGAETIFEYPMVDKDPVERWTFGRVTLAGDAAHPMYPRGSNGSAQALIDVRTLADCLAARSIPEALTDYEARRRETTAQIVRTNRSTPPDIINIRVEELTGDRPFDDLSRFISQAELQKLSDDYKRVAGFGLQDVTR
ncbi:flavin-dependent oxidoreductase [Sphingomonas parapaucimobilis]|jgi:2-polyprenyl-6-methoxyphenol hydroxylase-like FAD-dependent oxidoreductase|uniref:flavin-dependent oxidoreductase n=1 Tax=Sphingomonas parapaucimobilis TaxID=28213 RepID=UPI00321A54F3